jgi:hypothetical protein
MINYEYEDGGRTYKRSLAPYGTLETTGIPSLVWQLFRGTCLKCGREIGVAKPIPSIHSLESIPFDGIVGAENEYPGITFTPHTCPPAETRS